jgi:hypothetical protein
MGTRKTVTSVRISPPTRQAIERLRDYANKQAREESGIAIDAFPTTASFVRYLVDVGLTSAEAKLRRHVNALKRARGE